MDEKQYTFQREQKYLVLKWEDINKALAMNYQKKQLQKILSVIEVMRASQGKKDNSYVVINEDEPYAEQVWSLIKAQEEQNHAAGYVKVEPAEKLSNKDFLALPIEQRRKLLKEQVEAFLKTNPDFRVNDGELAPCPLSEQCHDDMMADCEHCPYRRYAVAQLAHDKAKNEELEIDYQMLSEEAKGLSDENKELKAAMVRLPSEELLISYLKQIDNTLNVNRWLSEYGKSEERFFLAAQELLKLLKGKQP